MSLTTEHRAAPSRDHIALQLRASATSATLSVLNEAGSEPQTCSPKPSARQRVQQALAQLDAPASVQHLRLLCAMRTSTLCPTLAELTEAGLVLRDASGYQLKASSDQALSLFPPIAPQGNGNRKHRSPPPQAPTS